MIKKHTVNRYSILSLLLSLILLTGLYYALPVIFDKIGSLYSLFSYNDLQNELVYYKNLNIKTLKNLDNPINSKNLIRSLSEIINKNEMTIESLHQNEADDKSTVNNYQIILKGNFKNTGFFLRDFENSNLSNQIIKVRLFKNDQNALLTELCFKN